MQPKPGSVKPAPTYSNVLSDAALRRLLADLETLEEGEEWKKGKSLDTDPR